MVQYRCVVSVKNEYEVVCGPFNGDIADDLERSQLPHITPFLHFLSFLCISGIAIVFRFCTQVGHIKC